MIRVDGQAFDLPRAERGWHAYDSHQRATRRASHRLGTRQREAVGVAFWTHAALPGVCYPTRAAAERAAVAALAAAGSEVQHGRR